MDALEGLGPGYRSGDVRAVLVPASRLGTGSVATVSGDLAGVTAVMFLEPPTPDAAALLLDLAGDAPDAIGVALPPGASPPGFIARTAAVTVLAAGRQLEFRVFSRDPLAAGPAAGEQPDVLDDRARWFESRHGED